MDLALSSSYRGSVCMRVENMCVFSCFLWHFTCLHLNLYRFFFLPVSLCLAEGQNSSQSTAGFSHCSWVRATWSLLLSFITPVYPGLKRAGSVITHSRGSPMMHDRNWFDFCALTISALWDWGTLTFFLFLIQVSKPLSRSWWSRDNAALVLHLIAIQMSSFKPALCCRHARSVSTLFSSGKAVVEGYL